MEVDGGFASCISIWELSVKVARGKLDLGLPVDELVERVAGSAVVELLPTDCSTWLRSASLSWEHRDPADRVIVATALRLGVPILTKDAQIQSFDGVQSVW